ncbi:Oxidoreductase molybdopterin binding domain-containing protein [Nocardioides terrae]|uniref:Oxidoreductase molybdopterin binding domain-containing protein n=1 Tax=Nocardioides terrae TaxID=574651 RepID=A0A1I1L3N0_9ACTN|nr:molybdopterin-dependent oxidoreductase [Nocardioides terrae]SFC67659.1 Oxidoreductase molybdopterin binding domain-containing protein [Nocardioides terrae]
MAASPEGAPVGRRVVLGLLGLGAVGVVTGSKVQAGLSDLLTPLQLRDPTGLTGLVPLGDTWRYYSVTGAVTPRDAASYALGISGLVDHPATYSLADLKALPQTSFTDTFQCVTGWRVPEVPWSGVRVADLLATATPAADAVGVRFGSFDGTYSVNMTLEQARRDDVIVALAMYGKPVTHAHGGPVRIYSGSMYGYKSTKWLSRIEVTPDNRPGYWEDRGYPLNGIIDE